MAERRWRSDYWLWALATTIVFVALGFVDPVGGKDNFDLWSNFQYLNRRYTNKEAVVEFIVFRSLLQAGPALLMGWLIQAVAVVCGLRVSGRVNQGLAAAKDEWRISE